MKIKNKAFKIAVLISILHCFLGNFVGAEADSTFIQCVFFPYSFIGGLANFAQWDCIVLILMLIALLIMTFIFYPIGLIFDKKA